MKYYKPKYIGTRNGFIFTCYSTPQNNYYVLVLHPKTGYRYNSAWDKIAFVSLIEATEWSINFNPIIFENMHYNDILKALDYYFHDKAKYKLSNAYVFKWESDYFVQRLNNYIYELEIKVSRADYFADFKKTEKHKALRGEPTKLKIPNKFIYVVPEGLIKKEEVPNYAGLYYIKEQYGKLRVIKIKEAPFLHKNIMNFDSVLCKKFYFMWLNAKYELQELKRKYKE